MKKILLQLILVFLLVPSLVFGQTADTPILASKAQSIVDTDNGKVRGYVHNGIYTFKGIPYGKADRFTAPSKPPAWDDVRSSMTYGPVCPTNPTTSVNDEMEFAFQHNWGYWNEDCLNLNVWTPQINDNQKRPVMVWLHGGGFTAGSSIELPSYDGENLSRKGDIVMVSINHRLNVLGFLDLTAYGEKYKGSSNAGLLDIKLALEWVKNNIAQFGGDPENVTIFGQSGGGGKVTCLMNAPAANGLFKKAIVQSGSYLDSFSEKTLTSEVTKALLLELNLTEAQVDSLQHVPYKTLNEAGNRALKKAQENLTAQGKAVPAFGLQWGPVLDKNFLPYQPSDAAARDLSKEIPLLLGSTKNEFAPFIPTSRVESMDAAKDYLQNTLGERTDAFMQEVEKAYPATDLASDYTSIDILFRAGAIRQANMKAVEGAAPVYMYMFTWQSPVLDGQLKSMHCMELPFMFDNIHRCEEMTGGGPEAYELAEKMSEAWINFSKTGDPNTDQLPEWPAYTAENGATMILDNTCEIVNHHDQELIKIATSENPMSGK